MSSAPLFSIITECLNSSILERYFVPLNYLVITINNTADQVSFCLIGLEPLSQPCKIVNIDHRLMTRHCFWPFVSDLSNLMSHKPIACQLITNDWLRTHFFNFIAAFQCKLWCTHFFNFIAAFQCKLWCTHFFNFIAAFQCKLWCTHFFNFIAALQCKLWCTHFLNFIAALQCKLWCTHFLNFIATLQCKLWCTHFLNFIAALQCKLWCTHFLNFIAALQCKL